MKDVIVEIIRGLYRLIYLILIISLIIITILVLVPITPIAFMLMLFIDVPIFKPIHWECEVMKSIFQNRH